MPKRYINLNNYFTSRIFAMEETKFAQVRQFFYNKFNGLDVDASAFEAKARPAATTQGNVAVIPLQGSITYRASAIDESSGVLSVNSFAKKFDALVADPSIKAIVIDIDSPGGSVDGVMELSQKIYDARGTKHIVAIANSMAASAAYWIGSAADELVVIPSGVVGSIGVFAMHEDWQQNLEDQGVKVTLVKAGEFKAEGNPYQPLSQEAQDYMQSQVDAYYKMFVDGVARNRGLSSADVKKNFGQGRVVMAADAKNAGMVDKVATLQQVLDKLGVKSTMQNTTTKNAAANKLKMLEHS